MIGTLLLLILLILVFGSLGVFVAKIFLLAMALTILLGMIGGGYYVGRR